VVAPYKAWRKQAADLGQRTQLEKGNATGWHARTDSLQRLVDSLRKASADAAVQSDRQQRDHIITKLGALIADGDSIKDKCLQGPYRPIQDAQRWMSRSRAYVRSSLGPGYAIRFDQAGPIRDGAFEGVNVTMSALWNEVDGKQAVLAEFIKETQGGRLP
jgi:hypothetical protein